MLCSPLNLSMAGPCQNGLNPFFVEVYKTALFCRWKQNLESGVPMTCNIQELFNDATCFLALPPFILRVIQIQLICDIMVLLTPPPVFGGSEFDVTSGQLVEDQPTGSTIQSQD